MSENEILRKELAKALKLGDYYHRRWKMVGMLDSAYIDEQVGKARISDEEIEKYINSCLSENQLKEKSGE